MDTMEKQVLEPRSEQISHYKADRRRELAQPFGKVKDVPYKCLKRDEREIHDSAAQTHKGNPDYPPANIDSVNGKSRRLENGFEADALADSTHLKRQSSQGSLSIVSEGESPRNHGSPGLDSQLHTRVSVGQLRSSLLQQTGCGIQSDKVHNTGVTTSSLDLAAKAGPEVARRRTRRYLPGMSSGARKASERFKTQPITANEMLESSGPKTDEQENSKVDVKTDDRAKMSVAAKMSLFKELEKSAAPQATTCLKPRSGSVCHERRVRRGNEHRSLTQPITCEEMVAISTPQLPPPVEPQTVETESIEDDVNCKLSVSEKLALFNKLSLPRTQRGSPTDGPPERRRQKGSRYHTQPITVEEVSQLQKGPVQLPAFSLSPHPPERKQVPSVNLKPSDVCLALSRPNTEPEPKGASPTQQDLQCCSSDPGMRRTLKKRHSGGPEWNRREGIQRNEKFGSPVADERTMSATPWRQRTRRGTVVCTSVRSSSEQDVPQESNSYQNEEQEHPETSVKHISGTAERDRVFDLPRRHLDDEERGSKTQRDTTSRGWVQVTPAADVTPLQQSENTCGMKEESEMPHDDSVKPFCWEPVFASVYSGSKTQYIMCFNQTNLSFEAQEVSTNNRIHTQPHWTQKAETAADEESHPVMVEVSYDNGEDRQYTNDRGRANSLAQIPVDSHMANKDLWSTESDEHETAVNKQPCTGAAASPFEGTSNGPITEALLDLKATTVEDPETSDGFLTREHLPLTPCVPPPSEGGAGIESDHDLSVVCQISTPILTSVVAEHRRSVRPSRRTQGSRNPLRALAAREDINQDYMEERMNIASEENNSIQAKKKSKNSNTDMSVPATNEDFTNSIVVTNRNYPPFSSPMLIQIKGQEIDGSLKDQAVDTGEP